MRALVGIAEDLVRLGDLLEARLGLRRRIAIGMIHHCQTAIGLLDIVVVRVTDNFEHA